MTLDIPTDLIERLRQANRVVALTGAGISAESGVPTFRDAQTGLWEQYQPDDLATRQAFQRNPKVVWDWYAWRRQLVAGVEPNPGHRALVALAASVPDFCLITQNVDGLHQRAGSRDVIELHGNIFRTKRWRDNRVVEHWDADGEMPPRCPDTGDLLRPDVVWFGESLPAGALRKAEAVSESCDVFFSIGTSSAVYPAAGLPFLALRHGACVVEVNPQPTALSDAAHYVLRGAAGELLPRLVNKLMAH